MYPNYIAGAMPSQLPNIIIPVAANDRDQHDGAGSTISTLVCIVRHTRILCTVMMLYIEDKMYCSSKGGHYIIV